MDYPTLLSLTTEDSLSLTEDWMDSAASMTGDELFGTLTLDQQQDSLNELYSMASQMTQTIGLGDFWFTHNLKSQDVQLNQQRLNDLYDDLEATFSDKE